MLMFNWSWESLLMNIRFETHWHMSIAVAGSCKNWIFPCQTMPLPSSCCTFSWSLNVNKLNVLINLNGYMNSYLVLRCSKANLQPWNNIIRNLHDYTFTLPLVSLILLFEENLLFLTGPLLIAVKCSLNRPYCINRL